MKVLLATYPWAFEVPGGGEIQVLKYEQYLPQFEIETLRHDPWRANLDDVQAVHYFSCIGGSVHFCDYVKSQGLPLIVSTSLWLTEDTKAEFPLEEIRTQLLCADRIVTNGVSESEQIARILDLPRDRFSEVFNGFDRRFGEAISPEPFCENFGVSPGYLLCVGNIEPRKNQLQLIRAANSLNMPVVLIGHIRDQTYASACFAEAGDNLTYVGALPHDSPLLHSAYAGCGVFCLPSMLETPGLAALEAAASGAQIVVTHEGSTHEYFGAMARYVDPTSVEDIAWAISEAASSPSNGALRQHVLAHFTWPNVTGHLANLYRTLL